MVIQNKTVFCFEQVTNSLPKYLFWFIIIRVQSPVGMMISWTFLKCVFTEKSSSLHTDLYDVCKVWAAKYNSQTKFKAVTWSWKKKLSMLIILQLQFHLYGLEHIVIGIFNRGLKIKPFITKLCASTTQFCEGSSKPVRLKYSVWPSMRILPTLYGFSQILHPLWFIYMKFIWIAITMIPLWLNNQLTVESKGPV